MSKKQIRLTRDSIRKMISEAIKSYSFDGEGFNDPKYPGGVFSTDSEEGDAFKELDKKYDKPEGDELVWKQTERKLKNAEGNVTGRKLDKMTRDEFGDEEQESERYNKPFGDMDDIENQWADEPGYEDEDDDDNIAGLNEGTVTLNEEGLRKFVSYSVAKLLKEAYRPIYRRLPNGDRDYDGEEYLGGPESNGSTDIDFSNDAILNALKEVADVEFDDQYKHKFISQHGQEPDENDFIGEMMRKIGFSSSVNVFLDFNVSEDPGDYWTPGNTTVELNSWEINSNDEGYMKASDMGKKIMQSAAAYEIEGNESELFGRLNEENLGVTTHFDGKSSFKPKNPYEGMTWHEYCEAKRKEREEDRMRIGKQTQADEKPNLGITTHFGGEKPEERSPEDDEHTFGDQYWVDKEMSLSRDDLQEMVKRAIKGVINRLG